MGSLLLKLAIALGIAASSCSENSHFDAQSKKSGANNVALDTTSIHKQPKAFDDKPGKSSANAKAETPKAAPKSNEVSDAAVPTKIDKVATSQVQDTELDVIAIVASPKIQDIAFGGTGKIEVKVTYEDNTVADITSKVVWKTSDAGVQISPAGIVTGAAAGTIKVTASLEGLSDQVEVNFLVKAKAPPICSAFYAVYGRSNPFFAGMGPGATIRYLESNPDTFETNAAIEIEPLEPACFEAGGGLFFETVGSVSHGGTSGTTPDGNSSDITSHTLGSYWGKSHITAPYESLVGVFLPVAADFRATDAPPSALPFETEAQRNFLTLSPKLGQLFFIGDGKTADGKAQQIIVPPGGARLFLGVMDSFEWVNNSGQLDVRIRSVEEQ